MIRLEFIEGTSSKFWEGQVNGLELTIRFGRIGSRGQLKTKSFATPGDAERELSVLVAEKKKKGYAEAKPRMDANVDVTISVRSLNVSKPEVVSEARPPNSLVFSHERKKLVAWVACEGAVIKWAEGKLGEPLKQHTKSMSSEDKAIEKRDVLIMGWMQRGFEIEVVTAPPLKKPSVIELRDLGLKAEREGRIEEAQVHYRASLEAELGEDADEILNAVSLSWRQGRVCGIRFDLEPLGIETSIKKSIKPLLNLRATLGVEQLTIAYEDSIWWADDLLSVLRVVCKSNSAATVKTLTFTCGLEIFNSLDAYAAIPSSEFAGLKNLESLQLRSTLVAVTPGKELSGLKHLYREMTEITVGEFSELCSGVWENLGTLSIEADSLLLDIPDDRVLDSEDLEEYEIEDLAVFRTGFERFLSGEHFPKLKTLILRLPKQYTELFGDISTCIRNSAIGKGLETLEGKRSFHPVLPPPPSSMRQPPIDYVRAVSQLDL
jgi:predicted DNA-binding WGR domain protein